MLSLLLCACLSVLLGAVPAGAHDGELLCAFCGTSLADLSDSAEISAPGDSAFAISDLVRNTTIAGHQFSKDGDQFRLLSFRRVFEDSIVIDMNALDPPSFFPPYHPDPLYCSRCGGFLGWMYTAPNQRKRLSPPFLEKEIGSIASNEEHTFLPLIGRCLTHEKSHFLFKWCFHESVKQSYMRDGVALYNYSLGHFSRGKPSLPNALRPTGSKGVAPASMAFVSGQPYWVESFTSGDPCDNLGFGRQTEAWLLAHSEFRILEVTEFEICHYRVVIGVPELSAEPLYQHRYQKCPFCHVTHLVHPSAKSCKFSAPEADLSVNTRRFATQTVGNLSHFYSLRREAVVSVGETIVSWMRNRTEAPFFV